MIDLEKELLGKYDCEKISEDHIKVKVTANPDWPYYAGHFPEHSVLPAVAIIDISDFLLKKLNMFQQTAKRVENFRIRNPVRAGDVILISIQQAEPNTFQIRWEDSAEQKIFAELTLF